MQTGIISFGDRVAWNIKCNMTKDIILNELFDKFNIRIIQKHYYNIDDNNIKYLSNFTIVTSTKDTKCKEICDSFGINCIVTDVMYENDAYFNKGKAINEGIKSLKDPSWILIMDADIMLTEPILNTELENNTIYTANRYHCLKESTLKKWKNNEIELKAIGDYEHDAGYGFFQLFNWNSNKINKNDSKIIYKKYIKNMLKSVKEFEKAFIKLSIYAKNEIEKKYYDIDEKLMPNILQIEEIEEFGNKQEMKIEEIERKYYKYKSKYLKLKKLKFQSS